MDRLPFLYYGTVPQAYFNQTTSFSLVYKVGMMVLIEVIVHLTRLALASKISNPNERILRCRGPQRKKTKRRR